MYEEKVTYYVSYDEKRFKSEHDCLLHEDKLIHEKLDDQVLALDADGKVISNPVKMWDLTAILYIKTDEAAEFLDKVLHRMWQLPWSDNADAPSKGAWVWFEYCEQWASLEKLNILFEKMLTNAPPWADNVIRDTIKSLLEKPNN